MKDFELAATISPLGSYLPQLRTFQWGILYDPDNVITLINHSVFNSSVILENFTVHPVTLW